MTCVTSLYRLGIDVGQVATYSLVLLESIILRLSTSLLFILFMLHVFAKNAVSVAVYKTLSKWYSAHMIFQWWFPEKALVRRCFFPLRTNMWLPILYTAVMFIGLQIYCIFSAIVGSSYQRYRLQPASHYICLGWRVCVYLRELRIWSVRPRKETNTTRWIACWLFSAW